MDDVVCGTIEDPSFGTGSYDVAVLSRSQENISTIIICISECMVECGHVYLYKKYVLHPRRLYDSFKQRNN